MLINRTLYKLILFFVFVFLVGCGSNNLTSIEKEPFRVFSSLIRDYLRLENIKIKEKKKYVRMNDNVYKAEIKNHLTYLKGIESDWKKELIQLEGFIQLNPKDRLSDDFEFVVAVFWSELGDINKEYLDRSTRGFENILEKGSRLPLEKEDSEELKKSKLFKWLINNFNNPDQERNVGSYREYVLRRIIRNYISAGDFNKASDRLNKAKSEGFIVNDTFKSIQDEIISAQKVFAFR